ncbi:uncharacterized protein TrAtP1_001928 [Trichoderma atroviride]|uniref:uncharacterized protein n=1 Tax=Hypocrea atroviridis TaxID=63577 RepID=UPI0033258DE1|nr:hypothetical protein TrAtP1_001928 [Trichoderma atroviride]
MPPDIEGIALRNMDGLLLEESLQLLQPLERGETEVVVKHNWRSSPRFGSRYVQTPSN